MENKALGLTYFIYYVTRRLELIEVSIQHFMTHRLMDAIKNNLSLNSTEIKRTIHEVVQEAVKKSLLSAEIEVCIFNYLFFFFNSV